MSSQDHSTRTSQPSSTSSEDLLHPGYNWLRNATLHRNATEITKEPPPTPAKVKVADPVTPPPPNQKRSSPVRKSKYRLLREAAQRGEECAYTPDPTNPVIPLHEGAERKVRVVHHPERGKAGKGAEGDEGRVYLMPPGPGKRGERDRIEPSVVDEGRLVGSSPDDGTAFGGKGKGKAVDEVSTVEPSAEDAKVHGKAGVTGRIEHSTGVSGSKGGA